MAIAAQLEESTVSPGAVREPRRQLRLEAQGATASGKSISVLIHNISSTGLLLESVLSLSLGEKIDVELPDAGLASAKVIWASGNLFGCQFHTPISAAALGAAQLRSPGAQGFDGQRQAVPVPDESFGIRLQRLRKERRLTLAQVASALGVSKPTVWAWENGRARPAGNRMTLLADALGIAEAQLLPEQRCLGELRDLLVRSREQIAEAFGTRPENIRIMVEL